MSRVRDGAISRQVSRRSMRIGARLLLALVLLTGGAGPMALNGAFGHGVPHVRSIADDPPPSLPCPGSPVHC